MTLKRRSFFLSIIIALTHVKELTSFLCHNYEGEAKACDGHDQCTFTFVKPTKNLWKIDPDVKGTVCAPEAMNANGTNKKPDCRVLSLNITCTCAQEFCNPRTAEDRERWAFFAHEAYYKENPKDVDLRENEANIFSQNATTEPPEDVSEPRLLFHIAGGSAVFVIVLIYLVVAIVQIVLKKRAKAKTPQTTTTTTTPTSRRRTRGATRS